MTDDTSRPAEAVGYRQPPAASRFRKGQTGNPRGRPRGSRSALPFDTVLGQNVTIREDGRERRVTAAEAFLLQLTRKGLQGDGVAARATLAAIELARSRKSPADGSAVRRMTKNLQLISFPLGLLKLAVWKHQRSERRARWELEPWLVEAALDRLGSRQLSKDEQREVWRATRTPHKVRWPEWWVVRG